MAIVDKYISHMTPLGSPDTYKLKAYLLKNGRTFKVKLNSTNDSTAFDGSANITDIGVSGILGTVNGGTGNDSFTKDTLIYANTATKLASYTSTKGGTKKLWYLNAGVPTDSTETVGATDKPVFLSSGTITASTSTIGSGIIPIYMSSGQIKASTSTVGNGEQPVYLNSGTIAKTTYYLKSNIEDGSANHLAYYSAARTIDYTPNITFINGLAADVGTGKIYGLEISGAITGTAANLKAGEVGILQYGDAGPQLRFDSSGQKGAIIFTEYDNMSDSGGASFHFVTNQYSQGAAIRARYLTAGDNQTAGRIRIYQAGAYGDISANDKSSYGALKLTQAKGGYVGLLIGNSSDSLTIMDAGASKGLYAQGTIGWLIYGHNTNKTVGIRTSSITSGYDIELGGTTHTSKLIHIDINSGTNLDNSRPLMIGPLTGANLAIGRNAIQARNNGEASILYLNHNAGSIQFGSSTSLTTPTKIFGTVTPGATDTYHLGTASLSWKTLNESFVARRVVFNMGDSPITAGWRRICKINAYEFYLNCMILITGRYSSAKPAGALVSIHSANASNITLNLLSGYAGSHLKKLRLVSISGSQYWLDIYTDALNDKSDGTHITYGNILFNFYGNVTVSDVQTSLTTQAATGGYEIDLINTAKIKLGAELANGYWGMTTATGANNDYIRTTTLGLIPYQSGGAGAGHGTLGATGWRFKTAYIDDIYSTTVHADLNGNAATATMPLGFSSRKTNAIWGNQVGTTVTSWNESSGGSVDWRQNNPQTGQLSIKVDGTIYINEGQYPVLAQKNANGYPGFLITANTTNHSTSAYGGGWNDTGWLRTTSNGFIPYQAGGAGSGHSSLGTSSWYFKTAYIDEIHGSLTGNASSATVLKDRTNSTLTYSNYGAAGLAASAITWLTCWNGYELRAISKTEMANATDSAHKWVRIGGDTMTGSLYSPDIRGDQLRMVDDWLGFYESANVGGKRYGFIEVNADRMYFRKENGVSTYHFDFNGHIYTSANIYAGTTSATTEHQVHARAAAGDIYLYSEGSATASRGIWLSAHGTGPGRDVFNVNTNNITTYYGGQLMYRTITNSTSHALALKAEFDNHKADIPRAQQISYYSSAMSNGSIAMGYFLSGYDDTPYGGFFVAHYNTPRYVGINGGTYTQWRLLKGADSGAIGGTSTPIYIDSNGIAQPCTAYNAGTNIRAATVNIHDDTTSKLFVLGATTTGYTSIYRESSVYMQNNVLRGAAWNDYAEFRQSKENKTIEPGRVVHENGDDTLSISTQRLMRGCNIVSDTYGFSIGESKKAQLPIAVSGRVLAYPYENREEFKNHIGWPVCSGPNGTVSIMTEEEEMKYPSRIIGTISAIPDYEIWHGGADVVVNGRIWIKVK